MSTPTELDVFSCPLDGTQLIEASAGTGKTWNICGLYLRLLLEHKRGVREILVVTFTNAATAELRERIRARLLDLSMALENGVAGDLFVQRFLHQVIASGRVDAEDAARRIKLALLSFDEASIFTIHGFCQRALADTPFAAALPFRFELAPVDSDLKREVANDYWRKQVVHGELGTELTAYLLEHGAGPDWLANHLTRRLRKPSAELRWPDFSVLSVTNPDFEDFYRLYRTAEQRWRAEREQIHALLLDALPQLSGNTYKEASLAEAMRLWQVYFDSQEPLAKLADKQALLSADRLSEKTKKNGATPRHPFFQEAEQLMTRHARLKEALELRRLKMLSEWLDFGPAELAARKQARRLVSFDDLLGKLFQALDGSEYPWLAAAVRQRFPCALIDEFQDTDPLQFGIFRHIYASGEARPSLFLVGDPKQAIYSFRSADLHTYLAARDQAARLHTLSDNQRSSAGLIDACNGLFQANGEAFVLNGLDYQPVRFGDKPRPAFLDASEPRGDLELWTLPQGEDGKPLTKQELRARVAETCAGEVARLLNGAEDGAIRVGERPLRASDIALVVRSHAQGARVRQALADCGVASVELSQRSIFATEQAEEVERVLQAILEPSRIGLVRTALATELLGLNGQQIFALNHDEAALAAWLERFQNYRRAWQEQGFPVLWQSLLRDQMAARRLLGTSNGERKFTNLLHLGELLASATDPRIGPESLLRWLAERRRDGSSDETAQLRLESDENLVQILTIHKSKGLEFPIVFCPYLWDTPMAHDGNEECLDYHRGDTAVLDFSLSAESRTLALQARGREDAAEQVRLIYVALTRAVHRCYLIAGNYLTVHGRNTSSKESNRGLLNWLAAGAGRSYSDWLAEGSAPAAITAAWRQLAKITPGVRLVGLPRLPDQPRYASAAPPEKFQARQMARLPQEAWRLSSFSGLIRGGLAERVTADRDPVASDSAPVQETSQEEPAATDILRFPRGEQAGHCLHRALELADYRKPDTWPPAIDQALDEYPLSDFGIEKPELNAMMLSLFGDLLATPLLEDLRLEKVEFGRRLNELEFCLPVGHLSPRSLEQWLKRHGYGGNTLSFAPYSGYLKGFIDLVFQFDGRYFLLDWKSNHLGYGPSDYASAGLKRAMDQHGYHLQSLCYTLALHRYLRFRLPEYDYDKHFGGCLYLFLRGVRPDWRTRDGAPAGVYFHRPEAATLAELERLFTQEVQGAPA